MSNTLRYEMPLLNAAQAQKHVTINEALVRADILSSRVVQTRSLSAPPASPVDSVAYIVGPLASGDWSGHEQDIALSLNGGWAYVTPWSGLQLWVAEEHTSVTYVSGQWLEGNLAVSANAATTYAHVIEIDHTLASDTTSTTPAVIPEKAIVLGVTARVITEIAGPSSWSLGVGVSPDRYGTGYGIQSGSFAHGVTGQPQAYYDPTELVITSSDVPFSAGELRLAVHYIALRPPELISA